ASLARNLSLWTPTLMRGELAGSQISALLEAVPGIASVLRNPVADAMVNMIRAGAGLGEFRIEDVEELVQYAIRRSLIGSDEGDRLLEEVRAARPPKKPAKGRAGAKGRHPQPARKPARAKKAASSRSRRH
ncbi:MAG TPA: hypothetical protein VNL18_02145, partial [Gemmatimonadales bacterium]|nr:hypothetical protein [Gemmatimonadales bacterium]